jgi:hypothetical protein
MLIFAWRFQLSRNAQKCFEVLVPGWRFAPTSCIVGSDMVVSWDLRLVTLLHVIT